MAGAVVGTETEQGLRQLAADTGMEVVILRPPLVRGMAQAAGVPARLLPAPVWALQAGATLLDEGLRRAVGNVKKPDFSGC